MTPPIIIKERMQFEETTTYAVFGALNEEDARERVSAFVMSGRHAGNEAAHRLVPLRHTREEAGDGGSYDLFEASPEDRDEVIGLVKPSPNMGTPEFAADPTIHASIADLNVESSSEAMIELLREIAATPQMFHAPTSKLGMRVKAFVEGIDKEQAARTELLQGLKSPTAIRPRRKP